MYMLCSTFDVNFRCTIVQIVLWIFVVYVYLRDTEVQWLVDGCVKTTWTQNGSDGSEPTAQLYSV